MKIEELVNGVSGFAGWKDADKIRFFAWFVHSKQGKERFITSDIRSCYEELGFQQPSNISSYLQSMEKRKPKDVLKNSRGYALEKRVKDDLEKKYGQRPATIQVEKVLAELPDKISNLAEKTFLNETIICYRAQAFRATVVMAWNLAYNHLCHYIINNHLATFNAQYPKTLAAKYAKAKMKAVVTIDDFSELQESEVIQITRSANIISNDVKKILDEKLGTRNTYAHPSNVVIVPHTAEEMILNLVNNIVLKYN